MTEWLADTDIADSYWKDGTSKLIKGTKNTSIQFQFPGIRCNSNYCRHLKDINERDFTEDELALLLFYFEASPSFHTIDVLPRKDGDSILLKCNNNKPSFFSCVNIILSKKTLTVAFFESKENSRKCIYRPHFYTLQNTQIAQFGKLHYSVT